MLGGDETGERDGGCSDRWTDGYEVKDGEGSITLHHVRWVMVDGSV